MKLDRIYHAEDQCGQCHRHRYFTGYILQRALQKRTRQLEGFFNGFGATLKFSPPLKLCATTFLVFNGFMLVSSFQCYVIIYYVFAGDQSLGTEYTGWAGTASAISTFCVIFIITRLSTRITACAETQSLGGILHNFKR
jgi:hypothetical protein